MLAQELQFSVRHFCRAFQQSTVMAPHRRVETAVALLRDRRLSLSEVALASGFANQARFTRVFSRVVGVTPGAWRRALEKQGIPLMDWASTPDRNRQCPLHVDR